MMTSLLFCLMVLVAVNLNGAALREAGREVSSGIGVSLSRYRQDLRNLWLGPVRIGLQIGHYRAPEHPDELASLRINTGASVAGVSEVSVNLAVAERIKARLEAYGVQVDLLPATVPPGYRADLFVSLHADSSPDPWRRGFKSAHFNPPRNSLEPILKAYLDASYAHLTGFPDDHHNVTRNMRHYYAFNHRRYRHTVNPRTPAVIFEMGYLSHPYERHTLSTAQGPADALSTGILNYLMSRGRLGEAGRN